MSAIRDILSIVGSIGIGWFVFCLSRYSERGMIEAILASGVCLFICLVAIRADSRRSHKLMAEKDRLDYRNTLLETSIRQGDSPRYTRELMTEATADGR